MKAAAPLLYLREEELTDGIELFFFAGRDFAKALDARLGELGLGRAHYRALHFVARHPGMPVSDLLSILGITKQSLSRVVRALTVGGYLSQMEGARDRRVAGDPSLTEGAVCDANGCTLPVAGGGYVTIALRSEAFAEDCLKAIAIVTSRQPPKDCAALIFDRARLAESGSIALRRQGASFVVDAVKPSGVDRPWAPAQRVSETNSAAAANRTAAPRPVARTPPPPRQPRTAIRTPTAPSWTMSFEIWTDQNASRR